MQGDRESMQLVGYPGGVRTHAAQDPLDAWAPQLCWLYPEGFERPSLLPIRDSSEAIVSKITTRKVAEVTVSRGGVHAS